MGRQPESRISTAIRKAIKKRGGFVFKVWGSAFMMAGLPDLICVYRGAFIAFEVKTAIGMVSDRQWYVMRAIKRAGGVVQVPRNVPDALKVLDAVDACFDEPEGAYGLVDVGLQMQQLMGK